MTKQPHLVVVLTEAEKRDQLIREALQSEPISMYPDFIAAVGAALDDLDRFRSERAFIVGCNEGFEAAIDQAARLIEEYSIMDTSGGKELSPRIDGNREGLHYAISIRALVAGNKEPSPTTTVNMEPVQDTYFVDSSLPVMAISGDVESDRVLKLHFRRPVSDEDRKALTDALNLHQRSLASTPAPHLVADDKPIDQIASHPEWIWYCESTSGVPVISLGRWPKHPQQRRYKYAETQETEHDHPAPSQMDEDDRTPVPDGYNAALWRKADEVFNDMALVADDTECLKILYEALVQAPAPRAEGDE